MFLTFEISYVIGIKLKIYSVCIVGIGNMAFTMVTSNCCINEGFIEIWYLLSCLLTVAFITIS